MNQIKVIKHIISFVDINFREFFDILNKIQSPECEKGFKGEYRLKFQKLERNYKKQGKIAEKENAMKR